MSFLWQSTLRARAPRSTSTKRRHQLGARDVYQTPIHYAGQPKTDKRERLYVPAEVVSGRLGISALHLPCEVLRDYFYVGNRRKPWDQQPTLYHVLRITSTASLAELRLAFKLRELELRAEASSKGDLTTLERAFNILAQPELRACYDALLSIPSQVPALLFPYGGFGSILVAGERVPGRPDLLCQPDFVLSA